MTTFPVQSGTKPLTMEKTQMVQLKGNVFKAVKLTVTPHLVHPHE
jgi:hypothetical protein